ncbi:hypothetical protein R2F61_08180 [Mollicutes bacterium LVI A0078]|nr:hypothetical protein RZE84_07955 [Mollicutes bacterium LVI A0075]WOO90691.1 hypothetical protein R2F61_08180 [Mollicutes bacterium LVI A0078]
MTLTIIFLEFLILSLNIHDETKVNYHCQVISFFSSDYPQVLFPLIFEIPLIYYEGQINLLKDIGYIIHSLNPSYYTQKVVKTLKQDINLIAPEINYNSKSKFFYLYDIIYCNDIKEFENCSCKLAFYLGIKLSHELYQQFITSIITKLYILEGVPSKLYFDFVNNCIDNECCVYALPSNIFTTMSALPNVMLSKGIEPLILNNVYVKDD